MTSPGRGGILTLDAPVEEKHGISPESESADAVGRESFVHSWEVWPVKNLIYAGVIVACVAIVLVLFLRGGNKTASEIPDAETTWVKCVKCNQGYEMSLKQYLREASEKSLANPAAASMRAPILLTCQKCGQDGILKAYKCAKCGEIFRENSVPNDLPDRCPKCKYSATLAKREANKAAQQN